MKIGFDVSQGGAMKAGCGYVAYSLARELAVTRRSDEITFLQTFGPHWWDPNHPTITYFGRDQTRLHYACSFANHGSAIEFWTKEADELELALGKPDIIHSNNFFCPPRFQHTKQVYTLHDMTVFETHEYTTENNRRACANGIARAAVTADFIVANSQYTLNNFLEYFDYDPERTAVIPLGSRFDSEITEPVRPQGLTKGLDRFILCVGTIEPRKNYDVVLEVFQILLRRHDIHLIIAGKAGWGMAEFTSLIDIWGIRNRVTLLSYVSDSELCWLYRNCLLFLYPSLWEGFGLPVLEAMGHGCPVVTSNVSALPEVLGDAGILVNPRQPETIVRAVDRILTDPTLRSQMAAESRWRANSFQWSKAAKIVGDIYNRLYQETQG